MTMNPRKARSYAWGVLLAGGDGTRLQSLTGRIEGDARPKQFCRILADESLLSQTRRRISPLFPSNRIVTVVTQRHEQFYAPELDGMPPEAIVVQPENLGTGIAIARTILLILLERDVDDLFAFFPCDHHYDDESAFLAVVEAGITAAGKNPDRVVLIGAEPTHPETDYGWIEPVGIVSGAGLGAAPVARFWEKPNAATAQEVLRRGCLWNTFVTIGRASTFIEMLCAAAPNAVLALTAAMSAGDLDAPGRLIPVLDFSRDVLAAQPERLLVIRDARSGWTDLGSPRRVFDTVARQTTAPLWLESIRSVEMLTTG